MLLLRLVFVLCLTVLIASGGAYLLTKDRRYLRFLVLTLKFLVVFMLGVLGFLAFERIILIL